MAIGDAVTTRRRMLLTALGGVGAAVAARLGSAPVAAAANGDALTAGGAFTETTALTLTNSATDGTAIVAAGTALGSGLRAFSYTGAAIFAFVGDPNAAGSTTLPVGGFFQVEAGTNQIGVQASATSGIGVWGSSSGGRNVAMYGQSQNGGLGVAGVSNDSLGADVTDIGVYGLGGGVGPAVGVWGESPTDTGVVGFGPWGVYGSGDVGLVGDVNVGQTGIYGFIGSTAAPNPPGNVAIYAAAATTAQTALRVNGKAVFSRSGRLTITAGHSSIAKTLSGVSTSSLVLATLQSLRSGVYVAAVVPTTGKFTIYLNKAVASSTYVAYFVLN
jgi:hypothetical protein